MKDIKVTLSQRPERAPNIEAEAEWMEEEGELWYPLGRNKPLEAVVGCWVYLLRDGHLVGRARAEDFEHFERSPSYTYSGEPGQLNGWEVKCVEIEVATRRPKHTGFQGFRYVSDEEQAEFAEAFR